MVYRVSNVFAAVVQLTRLFNNLTGCLEVHVQQWEDSVTIEKELRQNLLLTKPIEDTIALVEIEVFIVVKNILIILNRIWVSKKPFSA